MNRDLQEAVVAYRAAFPDAQVFYREDGAAALILADGENYLVAVEADGSTHSATINEDGWETGHTA